jgi:hypothetical protein
MSSTTSSSGLRYGSGVNRGLVHDDHHTQGLARDLQEANVLLAEIMMDGSLVYTDVLAVNGNGMLP